MNKTFQLIFVAIVLFSSSHLFAQTEFGLHANAGMAILKEAEGSESRKGVSGELGLYLKKSAGSKFFFSGQLNFSLIKDKDSRKVRVPDGDGFLISPNPNPLIGDERLKGTIGFLNLPLSIGVNFNKIQLELGFQGGLNILDREKYTLTVDRNGEEEKSTRTEKRDRINRFDYGPRIGMGYQLTSKVRVVGFYYHGLKDIIEGYEHRKVRQIGVGCSYSLN